MSKKIIIFAAILILGAILLAFALKQRQPQVKTEEGKDYHYFLEINYNKGELKLLSLELLEGYAEKPPIEPEDGWRVDLLSFKNEVLISFKFLPNVIYPYWVEPEPGAKPPGPTYLENIDFPLAVPYFKEGKTINIYNPQVQLKLSVDVSRFSKR